MYNDLEKEVLKIPDGSKLYIYGCGEIGEYVYDIIRHRKDVEVLGFIDRKASKGIFLFKNLEVMTLEHWCGLDAGSKVFIASNFFYYDVFAELAKAKKAEAVLNVRDRIHVIHNIEKVDPRSYLSKGRGYEELNIEDLSNSQLSVKPIAFYLPQFYPFHENDTWWGKGFTEWRNVTRGRSRFRGHYQPHLPSDFGYYDLRVEEVMEEQIELARKTGLYGFCFYYYFFNKKRLLDLPLDNFLKKKDFDFPFCLLWANENWTRKWDGKESEILIGQEYRECDDDALINSWLRYFEDDRYIRIDGRPLFIIYNPSSIPNARNKIRKWKEKLNDKGENPLIYMVQRIHDFEPDNYGLDGAIEFPPHKLASYLPRINPFLQDTEEKFSGDYFLYDDLVSASKNVSPDTFDLIRTIVPNWDNEPRRPLEGMGFVGSTPEKFECWLSDVIRYSIENPICGKQSFVLINAWNEWAEGAHLEPDIYWGAGYLNAVNRCLKRYVV